MTKMKSVRHETTLRETLQAIDASGAGVALLVDGQGRFERTITG